ncbi:hypothetical protein GGF32_009450 [Allomyces javanicus]|nr:hypothetical protein GGF32_009450 [Allomyces javanicus]
MPAVAVTVVYDFDTKLVLADELVHAIDAATVDESLDARGAVVKTALKEGKMDKDAVATLVTTITKRTLDVITRDAVLAHTLLLTAFYDQLRDGANKAKDLYAKVASGSADTADLDASRNFWAANMPADQPYELAEQTLAMPECATFRLHKPSVTCTSCATTFTAEHVAVRRFLALATHILVTRLAGTQIHPKTRLFTPMHRGNLADLEALFDKAEFTKRVAALPVLATWADVETIVFAPIIEAKRDALAPPATATGSAWSWPRTKT